ncbi:MAG: FtsW/RodA/SpoVE family cell cycle protein [Rikenellaceae bacterium]
MNNIEDLEIQSPQVKKVETPSKVFEPEVKPRRSLWETLLYDRIMGGDKVLWMIISILIFMSVLVVYSSTASLAYNELDGDTSYFLFDQLFNLSLGVMFMFIVYLFTYRTYGRLAELCAVFAFLLVVYAQIWGVEINGASRWVRIPGLGVTFQPSDFLRYSLVLYLCKKMNRIGDNFDDVYLLPNMFYTKGAPSNSYIIQKYTIPLLGPIAASCLLILLGNLSTAMMTFFVCCLMFYMARVRLREILRLVSVAVIGGVLLIAVLNLCGYDRAQTWINRGASYVGIETESLENNEDKDFQKEQAQVTVASGGFFWGKGPGQSTQRSNLPHSYSDFAYAFVIEEYGDLVAFLVLLFYMWLFARSKIIAQKLGSQFSSMLVLGLSLMITVQALINMAVSVGLAPVTGQTLPLISKGGSSVVFTCMALGMILSLSRDADKKALEPKLKGASVIEDNRIVIK